MKSEYVFPSPRDPNRPISKPTISEWLRKLSKKAIGRELYPYLMRHSRATELYKNSPSKIAQKFLGHGKDMSEFYSHLSSEDVKEIMTKTVYKLEELPPKEENELKVKLARQDKIINFILDKIERDMTRQERKEFKEIIQIQ